ncbi:MAG TPA: enoyl-CoA hydratase/isomerase family protein [Novosphingobium sp.]|nr:enoyl-CoA hydratase/isomerase family protein [Novosphingobium sp.]
MSEASPGLLFELDGSIATLTLNRPHEGNAMDTEMIGDLERAWQRIDADPAIRVAILTGTGERHFCTGASVGSLEIGSLTLQNRPNSAVNRFSPRMVQVSKPVICAVNGLVNGGGLHFVAESDIVIASRKAQFMDTHVSVGQVSGLESISVARRVGLGAALLMGLVGKAYRMDAERAHQLGLVDLLEDDAASALARARELAQAICQNSPQAMALTKRAIWGATEMPEPTASSVGWELLKSHWAHPDFKEGPQAFAEKRAPVWNPDPNARG